MTNTYNHAKIELEILVASHQDQNNRPVLEPFIPEILALCEKFGNNGDSGSSAPYTIKALTSAIEKLCHQKPLMPITGIDSEWMDVGVDDGQTVFQNRRCGAVFKNGVNGRPYYLDAIVWVGPEDDFFTGGATHEGKKYHSRQFIKLPFVPKTFYIEVDGDEDRRILIPEKLKEVFEYYVV